jgi:hypothetical protein
MLDELTDCWTVERWPWKVLRRKEEGEEGAGEEVGRRGGDFDEASLTVLVQSDLVPVVMEAQFRPPVWKAVCNWRRDWLKDTLANEGLHPLKLPNIAAAFISTAITRGNR